MFLFRAMVGQGATDTPVAVRDRPKGQQEDLVRPRASAPPVSRLVGEILRAHDGGPDGRDAADALDRAAAGAAISILAACASDEGVGPLPRVTSGLVEMLLDRSPAAE